MMFLAYVGYYLLAFAFVGAVVLHALWQNKRDAALAAARYDEDYRRWAYTPPMPERLPEEPDAAPPEVADGAADEIRRIIDPVLNRIASESPDEATARRRFRALADRLRAAVQAEMPS